MPLEPHLPNVLNVGDLTVANPARPMTGMSPLFWRQLLSMLKDQQVIPVVGPDVVVVEGENGPSTLSEHLARRVATLLELRTSESAVRPTLHDVACRYLEVAGDRRLGDVYWAVREALDEQPIPVPDALQQLARIDAFRLFVTTTFDDLLQRAIDIQRFDGQPRTRSFSYSPERVQDLPAPVAEMREPTVYYLLGRLSSVPDYVVTEEDTLEFVHSLQSETRRPHLLLDELRSHSLLLIGSGYSDWLMRFFLRIAKKERLLLARSKTDIVVERRSRSDVALAEFLRHFSAQTRIFGGGALEFINELGMRWEEYRASEPVEAHCREALARSHAREHAIFVSYAHEDREFASRLAGALRAAGLPVWFDQSGAADGSWGLAGGDDYRRKIMSQIRDAALFVPVMSRSVLTPERRFFREEWDEAIRVERQAAANQTFIVPVRVDEIPQSAPEVHPRLTELQWVDAERGIDLGPSVKRLQFVYRQNLLALSPAS